MTQTAHVGMVNWVMSGWLGRTTGQWARRIVEECVLACTLYTHNSGPLFSSLPQSALAAVNAGGAPQPPATAPPQPQPGELPQGPGAPGAEAATVQGRGGRAPGPGGASGGLSVEQRMALLGEQPLPATAAGAATRAPGPGAGGDMAAAGGSAPRVAEADRQALQAMLQSSFVRGETQVGRGWRRRVGVCACRVHRSMRVTKPHVRGFALGGSLKTAILYNMPCLPKSFCACLPFPTCKPPCAVVYLYMCEVFGRVPLPHRTCKRTVHLRRSSSRSSSSACAPAASRPPPPPLPPPPSCRASRAAAAPRQRCCSRTARAGCSSRRGPGAAALQVVCRSSGESSCRCGRLRTGGRSRCCASGSTCQTRTRASPRRSRWGARAAQHTYVT